MNSEKNNFPTAVDGVSSELVDEDGLLEPVIESSWVLDVDGSAYCPSCRERAAEDEETGGPILPRQCPRCGTLLKAKKLTSVPVFELSFIDDVPCRKNFIRKSKFPLGESDLEFVKGYVLTAIDSIETTNKATFLTVEQISTLMCAMDAASERLTTTEAYENFLEYSHKK